MSPELAFDLELAHGRCVGVRLPPAGPSFEALAGALLPEERAFAAGLGPVRRRGWVGGRVAMRLALARAGLEAPPVTSDERGAPVLPSGLAGSLSHKEHVAVALVAREARARLGVDIELDVPRRVDVSRRVLAEDELAEVAGLSPMEHDREVLLRFSAKEAIYKALDPFVRRYVAFREVSVTPREDGSAGARMHLPAAEGPFAVEVRWRRLDGLVLTTARVDLSPSGTS
ncbi:MAG TPA: 4'-phosphopantetheinyl transferase superfamily protein [Polyangiaceae bacterium]